MKKKVLFLIESLSGGGAEKVLTTLVQNINKDNFDVTVCSIVNAGVYQDEIKSCVNYCYLLDSEKSKSGSILHRLSYILKYKLIYNLLPAKWVYKLFIPKGFDVEVAFIEGFVTKILSASTNKHSKKLSWLHIDLKLNPWTQIAKIYSNTHEEIDAYSRFDNVIAVSKTVGTNFAETYGIKPVVIYNPLDENKIISLSNQVQTLKFDANFTNIVTVGRLVPQKGYDRLLKVVTRLKNEGYALKLYVIGEGCERVKLQQYINKNSLNNDVFLLGFQKNPYAIVANCDAFVCSSRSEGFSLVVAEAMILGIPIVSTYCSGPNELLKEGEFGVLTENNEDGIYSGLKMILDSSEQRTELKKKAKIRAKMFSINSSMIEIEKILS